MATHLFSVRAGHLHRYSYLVGGAPALSPQLAAHWNGLVIESANGKPNASYSTTTRVRGAPRKQNLSATFVGCPLLFADTQIPSDVRQALVENRLQDAAIILMEEYGLSCVEVTHLLDMSPCKKNSARSSNRQSALMGRK
jgi:hypothetical protein